MKCTIGVTSNQQKSFPKTIVKAALANIDMLTTEKTKRYIKVLLNY